MKMIFKKMSVGLVLVGVAMLAGCSLGVNESTSYSIPNWTADGRIIARKVYLKTEHTLVSNSEIRAYQNSIVVMDDNGGHEQKLFDVDENGISLVEMSPSGNYVGYINSMSLLKVFKNEGGRWNLKWTKTVESFTDRISFSPDESKLYISEGSYQFKIFDSNGRELWHETLGGGGGFKTNSEVLFNQDSTTSLKLSLFNVLTGITTVVRPGTYIDEYVISGNSIVTALSSYALTTNLDTGVIVTTNFTYTPYKYEDFVGRHLSPDGKKIVMSAKGPEFQGSGIYVLSIDTSQTGVLR